MLKYVYTTQRLIIIELIPILKQASDTCNHEILFLKLKKYGIKDTELLWFKSYLTYRKQFVSIKNKASTLLNITLGTTRLNAWSTIIFNLHKWSATVVFFSFAFVCW